MSNADKLGALEYEAETSAALWGEDVATFTTLRIPITAPISLSGIKQDKIESARVVQYLQEGTPHILGPMEGSFTTEFWAHGHGATMAGSPTLDAMETFLGFVFGTAALSATTSTTASAGTATAWTTASSGAFTAGGLVRLGSLGDAKGNGQMFPISTCVTTTLTNLFASDGAPTAADVVYPVVHMHFPEDATAAATAIRGLRFRWRTANLGMEFHGCWPMSAKLSGTNTGEIPKWTITWGVSWWRYTATSGVSSVTSNTYNPAPIAAGSLIVADVGTSTRTKRTYRNFAVDITLGMVPLLGPGGVNAYQTVIGAKRVPSTIKVSWVEDADTATATPVLDGYFTSGTKKHAMWTGSTTNGSAIGIYFPSLNICGPRPVQMMDGGVNRIPIEAYANTGATTTSELTLSAMRIGYA